MDVDSFVVDIIPNIILFYSFGKNSAEDSLAALHSGFDAGWFCHRYMY